MSISEGVPRVTVFVPAFNRVRLVPDAVASVLAQTYTDFELLVVDDGSTDGTADAVAAFGDPRIRLERNATNLGIPKTRNRGLALARGEYIAMLDSDDRMHPRRLERQIAFLDANPAVVQVGSWGRLIDAAGRPRPSIRVQPVRPEDVEVHLLFRCCVSNRSTTGRTAVLREHGYDEAFHRCQDYDLFVRLSRRHRLANMPELLVYGREHPGQITRQTTDLGDALKRRIAARQLAELGVAAGEEDLIRHIALSRTRTNGLRPDLAYLDWAEDWLAGIIAANRRSRRYDAAALDEAVAEVWLKACLGSVAAGEGRAMWRFARSPLRRGAIAGYRRALSAALAARLGGAASAPRGGPAGAAVGRGV